MTTTTQCPDCHGSGRIHEDAEDGAALVTCTRCGGTGTIPEEADDGAAD